MKILAHLHGFIGRHNAGAERYVESMLSFMVERGHECAVLCPANMGEHGSKVSGITLFTEQFKDEKAIRELYSQYDYILTHLDLTPGIIKRCHDLNKRLIYVVHNQHSIPYWQIKPTDAFLFVWNSEWLEHKHHDHYGFRAEHEMVVTPYTRPELFDTRDSHVVRDKITLINVNENKGALQFIMLAKLLPEYNFLGVKGAYGDQILRFPKNVTLIEHEPDIKKVYEQTKVLVLPSRKETWGMAGLEAMSSGIPVIAHPTEGLMEALGGSALFAIRDKAYVWRDLTKRLMTDQDYYNYVSELSLQRAEKMAAQAQSELNRLEKFLNAQANTGH